MSTVRRIETEKRWIPSIGENLSKDHFREPPPGTGHAECDRVSGKCVVHYDKVNPIVDPIGHLLEDSPQTVAGLIVGSITSLLHYRSRRKLGEALVVGGGAGVATYLLLKVVCGRAKRNNTCNG